MHEHFTIPQSARELNSRLRTERESITNGAGRVVDSRSDLTYIPPAVVGRKSTFYDSSKRGIDICLSILLLGASLPLIMIIAAMIKITSSGKVIYKHRRLGMQGHEFDCWKFRTMVENADEVLRTNSQLQKQFEDNFKIDKDPRITPLGRLLRTTSLDELPQLVQVLQGKMSLIGPRPIITRELDKYSIYGAKLLSVKPGLSGLWQTSGRSDTSYPERVLLDMQYVDNQSLALDIKLIFKTVVTVLKKTGAH